MLSQAARADFSKDRSTSITRLHGTMCLLWTRNQSVTLRPLSFEKCHITERFRPDVEDLCQRTALALDMITSKV